MKPLSSIRPSAIFLLAMAGFFTLTTSCKKEKSIAEPPPVQGKLQEYRNGDEFIKFTYNSDGTVQRATVKNELNTSGDVVDFDISYDGDKKIAFINSSSGEKLVPVYTGNLITRADMFLDNDRTGYTTYLYNNGNLERATIYMGGGNQYNPVLEFNLTYNASGNCTESVLMVSTQVPGQMVRAGHASFAHDQKINPLYEQKTLLWLLWHPVSKNNITVENQYDASLALEDSYSYTYSYHTNGLPEKATVKQGLPGQPPVISNVSFVYK